MSSILISGGADINCKARVQSPKLKGLGLTWSFFGSDRSIHSIQRALIAIRAIRGHSKSNQSSRALRVHSEGLQRELRAIRLRHAVRA